MSDRDALVEAAQFVHRDLETRNYRYSGVVAQLARFAATAITDDAPTPEGQCQGCGNPLVYSGHGRPRKWCEECAR